MPLDAEEIKLRGTLLRSNKELLQLHRTLVRGGLLSEEEFWETRQNQGTLLKQRKPLPSILGDELQNTLEYQSENKIILTPGTIQAILAQNPAVQRAYTENVPAKLGEKDFWTFYVKSRFFRKSSDSVSPTEHNPLNDYFEEPLALEVSSNTESVLLSRMVDISATTEDRSSDLRSRTAEHLRSQKGDESLSLIRKFNNHSLRIVEATSGGAPPLRIEDSLELEDLTAEPEVKSFSLDISSEKVGAQTGIVASNRRNLDPLFLQSLSNIQFEVLPFIKSSLCTYEERRDLFTPYNAFLPEQEHENKEPILPNSDLELFHNNTAEVLRHFWAAYPSGKDADRQAKLSRMTTILEQLLIKGKELVSSKRTIHEQAWVEQTLSGIFSAVEYALETQEPKIFEHKGKRTKLDIKT